MWNHMQCIHNSHRNWDESKGIKRWAQRHIGPYWPKMFINSVGLLFIFLLAWLRNAAKIGGTDSALVFLFFHRIIRGWLLRDSDETFWFEGLTYFFDLSGGVFFFLHAGQKQIWTDKELFKCVAASDNFYGKLSFQKYHKWEFTINQDGTTWSDDYRAGLIIWGKGGLGGQGRVTVGEKSSIWQKNIYGWLICFN